MGARMGTLALFYRLGGVPPLVHFYFFDRWVLESQDRDHSSWSEAFFYYIYIIGPWFGSLPSVGKIVENPLLVLPIEPGSKVEMGTQSVESDWNRTRNYKKKRPRGSEEEVYRFE